MAKGHEIHQAREQALRGLGKDLARRAKSKCELTGAAGVPLAAYELPPVEKEPSLERTLLISGDCLEALMRPKTLSGQAWRGLTETLWSELPAAQVVAWRMLAVLAVKEDWARSALEESQLDDETLAWAEAAPLQP
jgi:protein PhnA